MPRQRAVILPFALLFLALGLVPARGQDVPTLSEFHSLDTPIRLVTETAPATPSAVSDFVPAVQLTTTSAAEVLPPAVEEELPLPDYPLVWGVIGARGYIFGDHLAPNGVEFNPLFSLDLDFNIWLWRRQGIYLYFDSRFWGQKPGPGITNGNQGIFDFSKREMDFTGGIAWNYYGNWEARAFAYSYNNLNRGDSLSDPFGFNDGVGLENRYYLSDEYFQLGHRDYDIDRSSFASIGYYPTKDMVDVLGQPFKPSLFLRTYLTYDLNKDRCYLYLDAQLIDEKPLTPKMMYFDGGIAVRPVSAVPTLEFRVGSEDSYDLQVRQWEASMYVGIRLRF